MITRKLFDGLTITAAIAVAAAGVALWANTTWPSRAAGGEKVFADVAQRLNDSTELVVKSGRKVLTISKADDVWQLKDKGGFPAKTETVRTALLAVGQMAVVEEKTKNPKRYHLLELDDPSKDAANSKLFEMKDKDGKQIASLIIGKVKRDVLGPGKPATYVRIPDNPQTWLVSGEVKVPIDAKDWVERSIYDIPDETISSVEVTHQDGAKLIFKRNQAKDKVTDFVIENLPVGSTLKPNSPVELTAVSFGSLELTDIRQRSSGKLPGSPVLKFELKTSDGLVLSGALSKQEENHWVSIDASGIGDAEAKAKEIEAKTGQWYFQIPSYKATLFSKRLSDFTESS